eukprot:3234762-Amphidinium_carterae.1
MEFQPPLATLESICNSARLLVVSLVQNILQPQPTWVCSDARRGSKGRNQEGSLSKRKGVPT